MIEMISPALVELREVIEESDPVRRLVLYDEWKRNWVEQANTVVAIIAEVMKLAKPDAARVFQAQAEAALGGLGDFIVRDPRVVTATLLPYDPRAALFQYALSTHVLLATPKSEPARPPVERMGPMQLLAPGKG